MFFLFLGFALVFAILVIVLAKLGGFILSGPKAWLDAIVSFAFLIIKITVGLFAVAALGHLVG